MAKMPIGGGFGARPKSPTPSLTSIDHKLTEIRQLENIEMKKLQELLRMRPELLTLEWLMDRVADEIEYSVHRDRCTGFVVDIMPNQRFLLKSEYLIKDCTAELAAFEERFPIALCLNLAMPQEKLLDNLDAAHKAGEKNLNGASGAAGSSSSLSSIASNATTTSTASGSATPAAGPGDEPLPTLPSGQSDEMDASRMQKRYTLYESSAYYFLTYFVQSGRVLTIDCSSKLPALIWQKLCDSVIELGFVPDRPASVVIIFGFEPDTFASFDLSKYRIKHVYLADILNEQHVDAKLLSPEQACHVLNQHVHDAMANATAFAVELSGTSLASHVARPQSSTASLKSARIDSTTVANTTSGNRSSPNNNNNNKPATNSISVRGVGQTPKVSPAHQHQHASSHSASATSQQKNSSGGGILHKNDTNVAPTDPVSFHPTSSSSSVAPRLLTTPQLVSPRQKEDLLFVEIHEVMLDKYVQLQSGNVRKLKRKNSLSTRRFKAICLPEQELVCLFPESVDTRTCKAISAGIVNAKRQVYRERRDSSRRSSNQSESLAAAAADHNNVEQQQHSNSLVVGGSRVSLVSPMPPLPTSRTNSNKLIPPTQPSR